MIFNTFPVGTSNATSSFVFPPTLIISGPVELYSSFIRSSIDTDRGFREVGRERGKERVKRERERKSKHTLLMAWQSK